MKKAIKKVTKRASKRPAKRFVKPVVVAVSGGFDPIHVGHARMFEEAKKLGDRLVVILNNDHWLHAKKGYAFMPEEERAELIRRMKHVDEVVLTRHKRGTKDMSVVHVLKTLKPDVFANGGDRKAGNIPEVPVCEALGIKMIFNIGFGGKVQSSSWLLAAYQERTAPESRTKKKSKK